MKQKPQRYLTYLRLAARWHLAPPEAKIVLDDYEEILSHTTYPKAELPKRLGSPLQAVRQLTDPRHYHRWLTVFCLLTACLLLPLLSLTPPCSSLWELFTGGRLFRLPAILLLGLFLSLSWFRGGICQTKKGFPKGILPFLLLQLAAILAVWAAIFLLLFCSEKLIYFSEQAKSSPLPFGLLPGPALHLVLQSVCLLFAITAEYGLLQARLTDRRWRAAYVLGLAGCLLCIATIGIVVSLKLDISPGWQRPFLLRFLSLTVIGLAGAGGSLC